MNYAGQIAQATLWRMLRLPCVLVLLIPVNVLRFFETWAADITVIVSAFLIVVAGIGLPLVTRSQLRTVSRRMTLKLESDGRTVSSMPELRRPEEFRARRADEGLTAEDIRSGGLEA